MSQTVNKNLTKPANNSDIDTWDVPVNANSDIIDTALANDSYINLTGLSSYTLTYTDLAARSLVFTGTLNNATVTVKMTNGVSYEGEIINLTASGGASSLLSLGWTGAGNSYTFMQGASQIMTADGLNPTTTGWQASTLEYPNYASASAFGANAGIGRMMVTIDVTGLGPGTTALSTFLARFPIIKFTGTLVNGLLRFNYPAGTTILGGMIWNVTSGGGASVLAIGYVGGTQTANVATPSVGGLALIGDGVIMVGR